LAKAVRRIGSAAKRIQDAGRAHPGA